MPLVNVPFCICHIEFCAVQPFPIPMTATQFKTHSNTIEISFAHTIMYQFDANDLSRCTCEIELYSIFNVLFSVFLNSNDSFFFIKSFYHRKLWFAHFSIIWITWQLCMHRTQHTNNLHMDFYWCAIWTFSK